MTRGIALGALACAWLLAAPAAEAAPGHGSADIRLAQHAKGRTLSGQGVKVIAGAPAQKAGNVLSLPISQVDPGAAASAGSDGWLRFKRGKRGVALGSLRFDLATATLNGRLGGEEIAVFKLGAPAQVDPAARRISVAGAQLRLTAEAATTLRQRLGLEQPLLRKGIGVLWLSAQASSEPKPAPVNPPTRVAVPVVSGQIGWGVIASWRKYVLGSQGPGSQGTITPAEGATADGNLSEPSGYFGFPMAGDSTFERGLHGASDRLVLSTAGSVTFAKPAHCITEIRLADLVVTLDGAGSNLVLDSVYDIETPPGCAPQAPVATSDVTFATLDPSSVSPTYSADGKTVTWNAVPATLTAEGATAFGLSNQYPEGQELDPVTITVGLG
ncbi:MAG TPA: HtaA domain-containing protein [Solirubrobacterales bacterium]|nr:HtaA domain-containing protein [Solirubrobacterales bacterium]